jgi:hypothetical protein
MECSSERGAAKRDASSKDEVDSMAKTENLN